VGGELDVPHRTRLLRRTWGGPRIPGTDEVSTSEVARATKAVLLGALLGVLLALLAGRRRGRN